MRFCLASPAGMFEFLIFEISRAFLSTLVTHKFCEQGTQQKMGFWLTMYNDVSPSIISAYRFIFGPHAQEKKVSLKRQSVLQFSKQWQKEKFLLNTLYIQVGILPDPDEMM